jgi:hypothetical protein
MAKRAGSLSIPPIAFGVNKSHSPSILVNQSSAKSGSPDLNDDLFLQVDASPNNPYVQEQVIYTLKLFRRLNLAQASLTEPEVPAAVVVKLDEDRNYNTRFDGEDYIVTERKYAIFPQRSGPLTIAPIALTAAVIINNQRRRFNGFFNQPSTRTRRVVSKALTLNVLPIPAEQKAKNWLPAEQVYIEQQWSADINNLVAGEPITRTVTLLVKGSTVSQIPELNFSTKIISTDTNGQLKNYPDQPVLKEQHKADGLVAFREEKIAYIPSAAGTYQLPEIVISWWNVNTQSIEQASLPTVTLTAAAASDSALIDNDQDPAAANNALSNNALIGSDNSLNPWIWLAAFLACGWLATTMYFLTQRQAEQTQPRDKTLKNKQLSIRKSLRHACTKNDASAAKDALLRWAKQEYNLTSLGKLSTVCNQPLSQEVERLNNHLYGHAEATWNGQRLFDQFQKQDRNDKKQSNSDVLEPLHRL